MNKQERCCALNLNELEVEGPRWDGDYGMYTLHVGARDCQSHICILRETLAELYGEDPDEVTVVRLRSEHANEDNVNAIMRKAEWYEMNKLELSAPDSDTLRELLIEDKLITNPSRLGDTPGPN